MKLEIENVRELLEYKLITKHDRPYSEPRTVEWAVNEDIRRLVDIFLKLLEER